MTETQIKINNQIVDWAKYFPIYKPRDQQIKVINFILDEFLNKNKRFVIVDLPTGTGKSWIGTTIAKVLESLHNKSDFQKGTWFLTTQKILQDQYIKDFGVPNGQLYSLKSSSNYQCDYFHRNTCQDSLKMLKDANKNTNFFKSCMFNCKYRIAKKAYLSKSESLTNFPYFLTYTTFDKENNVKPRELLVCDEAHNIEENISSFVQISISQSFTEDYLNTKFVKNYDDDSKVINWIKTNLISAINKKFVQLNKEIQELVDKGMEESEEMNRLTTSHEKLKIYSDKIDNFIELYTPENWASNIIETNKGIKVEFKSIDVGKYTEKYLYRFGNKILLMSATILEKEAFCESIGINPKEASFISVGSPFNQEKSPIYYFPVGKMNKESIDKTLPSMVEAINHILSEHKNEKGIIHTHNYKISQYLINNLNNKKRLITHESNDREENIKKFISSKDPLVLISPSSTEGLDLKDDLSRFQIICKIPFPFLGDKLVVLRKNKKPLWYDYQTVKTIVQGRGRSIRNEDDYAITYILDESWEYFYQKCNKLFPEYFKKAVKNL